MVAVVTGNNLGLVAGSAGVLGSNGQLGSAATGRGGDAAFVNATTGNLTIQRQDELLIGVGPDIGIVRTYNSKGTFDFDNNDNWQISLYRRVFGVTGTVNTAGSTIKRTGADGAELIHTYDTTLAKYVNKDGSGSFNTLTYNAGTNAWTWVNGDSRTTEAYELQTTGTYRIKTLADSDGNILTYSYDAATSLITQVADANGEKTQLIYNTTTKQLSQINVVNSSNVTTTRVRYTYDTNTPIARLISVSTDLTPVDGSIADGNAYVTTYAYVGTTNLVSSITNSDGTKTSFTYDASNRVATVTDGTGYITNFAYPSSTTATITDAASQVTTLTYSAVADGSIGQLTGIQDPSGSGQNILYAYDTSGNVTQMTDSRGNVTKYTYDTNGNQTRQEDALGNTITRTFSATNQLLSETVYATPDTVPGDTTYNAALPQTTRYVYDDSVGGTNNRLRFMISPEGRVTEYQYNAVGQRIVSIQYAGLTSIATNLYTTAGTPTEAQMTSWAGATDKTKSQRSDYGYDVRGQLSTRSTYTTVNAAGAGVVDATTATTQYVYDQNGNLVQAIDARGVATTAITTDFITSYSYDGLNRLVSQTDALGNVTTSVFDDTSNRQVKVTLANGLVTTSSYDAAGRLLSVSNGQAATPTALGTISYLYNNLGQLRQIIDPTGQKTYYIYDSLGRKVGAIDPQLALTEYVYNNNNQVVRIIQYTNAVTATLNATTALTITLASTRPVLAATTDRLDRNLYDKVGRLAKQVSAVGAVTEYQYDGASRLVTTIGYANLLSVAQLNALAALSTEPLATDANTIPVADATNDRRARQFYSDDGLLAATLDGEGYLTEYTYNAAGQRTSSIRYGTITPSAQWVSGALSALRPALDVNNDQTSYNIYNARGQLEGSVDALGYLTEYQYDTVGNRTLTTRYATSITYTVGVSVAASRPADALTNSENQSSTTTYDANNRVTSNTSAPDGLITNYSYDTVGNLTQKVNTFSGATALDNRSQFKQYDQLGRVTRELSGEGVLALQALVSPTQVQIDAVWDSYGNRYTYDLAGRVMAATTANGANTTGNKSLYYYDNEGKLKYQVNALGEVTQYNYNNFDNTTTTRRYNTRIVATTLATMTGGFATAVDATITALVAGGYSDTLAAYSNLGQTTTLTDALANANSRSYNAFGERKDTTNKIDASTTNITSYVYDRRGMVKTTTEDSAAINRITQAVYDAFGRITQTTDGRGGIVKRSYDKLGREVSVWDANSNAASLTTNNSFTTYDAFSRVLTRRDGRGVAGGYNTVSYSYNSTARSMTMTTAEGVSMITTKNRFGETVQITDGRNNVTTYTYNTDGQLKSTTTPTGTVATPTTSTNTTTYDAAGHVTTTTDARGINTTFSYDAANRVLSRTVDPTSLNPTGLNLITQYSYDALGRQTWVKDAKGVWTRTDYDAKGQVTSMVVDPSTIPVIDAVTGLVTTTTANATGLNITTNFTYDARGKRLTVVEAAGSSQPKTTQYLYDKLGRLTQTAIDPAGLNLRTSYSYDKNDNVVLKTDANGNKTVYSYDANNRLIYTVDALGDVSKNDYDIDGNVLTTTKYATPLVAATLTTLLATPSTAIVPTVNAAADLVTRNVYDKDNRRSFGIDALGYVTKYEYDANRNVTKTTQYGNAMVGAATAGVAPRILATAGTGNYVVISANDQVTQMTYDAANRAITSTDALGITTSYTYDANGNQLSVTEGVGTASQRITRQEFDAMGRKTAAVDALGYRTETTYDALGNIVTVKDAKGAMGYFYYDAASRMTLQVNPEGAVTETLYNALGNQTDIIRYATKFVGTLMVGTKPAITANVNLDQRQVVTYDAASRKLNIKTAFANTGGQTLDSTAGTGNAYIESFTYDAFGNVLTSIARNGASTTYSYDALNRKVTETLPINSKNASNVLTVVQNSFVYDTFGNLSTKTEAVGLPEQRMTTYVYDLLNRQTQEIGQTFTSFNPITQANVSVIPTRTKTYDARGNVTSETDANNNKTIYYYDSLDRRIGSVTTDGVYTKWTYDAVGNKIGQTIYANKVSNPTVGSIPAVTLDAPNDRTTIYRYDSVGRLTETEIQNITFGSVNAANQYIVSTGSIKTLTSYDALGNVVKVVDANNGLLAPTDPNYKATRIWYNNAGQTMAQVDSLGYLITWTRDVYGNITKETRYAKKPSAAATPLIVNDATTLAQLTTTAATLADVANDRITDVVFDRLNRVKTESKLNVVQSVVNATTGVLTATTAAATTSYTYDALNNVLQKTDAVGAVTNWIYDGVGRETSRIDPIISAYETATTSISKSPRTDKVYDGLNNVTKELKRGLNDAVETDDQVTKYEYDIGGKLSAMVDATLARTEYKYDANGNISKKTLLNRVNADAVGTNDISIYNYDAQNRQLKTQDISTGLISEVQYNSFNQIAGKRSYADAVPTAWQETAQYDQAGRAWKSNSGDGVTKVSIYDQNGNATLSISGTLDMRNMSLTQVIAQKAADTAAGVAQQTLYSMSVYDAKNELINTIQPSMDSTKDVVIVQTNTNAGSVFVGNNLNITISSTSSLVAQTYANNLQRNPGATSREIANRYAFAAIKNDGSVVTWGSAISGGDSSAVASLLNGSVKVTQIYSTELAFAALRADGSVVTWGDASTGGNSNLVASQLNGTVKVTQIYSTGLAFAALRADGSVFTWGNAQSGGDSSIVYGAGGAVASQMNGSVKVTQIYSNGAAFAALREDGSVVTWGSYFYFYGGSALPSQLNGSSVKVTQIFSTGVLVSGQTYAGAFAALRTDGSVVTFGDPGYGGDSTAVASLLTGAVPVKQIYANGRAFAALRVDGTVVTWGDSFYGGNSSAVASQLNGVNKVTQIYSTRSAFAALLSNGSVVTWGNVDYGGNSSVATRNFVTYTTSYVSVASQLINVTQIYSNAFAFAALRADGSVVTWGNALSGGNSSVATQTNPTVTTSVVTYTSVASQLSGGIKVSQIYATGNAFAALRADGSVVTWGNSSGGGNSSLVTSQMNGAVKVTQIYSNAIAFAALRANGSVVTWSDASSGGDSFAVLARLTSGVLTVSDINTDTFVIPAAFKLAITEQVSTQYIDISYRPFGSTGVYTTVRVMPTAAGSGSYSWDVNSLVANPSNSYDYDVVIKAYDAGDLPNNQTNTTIRLGATSSIFNTVVSPAPQLLRVRPAQAGISYLNLGYRLKGSNDNYVPLTTTAYNNNGTIEYRGALPTGSAANDYEYRYTAYAANTLDANGITVLNPLGISTGYFTVAAASTTARKIDWVITNTASTSNQISRKQSYNAFGEVIQEVDGRGNVTDLTYNTLGKLTLKRDPIADFTLANGFVQTGTRSQTEYTYDALGRLIATTDDDDNNATNGVRTNTQVWLAGGNGEQIVYERHADGGIKTNKYDIFGNTRIAVNEAVRQTDYTYDNNNRLTRIDRPQRLSTVAGYIATRTYDLYGYDAAGQRITHTDSLGNVEKTYYDSLGRVTQTKSYLGLPTSYSYVYSNAITGIGGTIGGGWVKTTTRSDGRTDIDKMDMFNHTTWHQDLGGHQFTYNYNQAGWLMSQSSLGTGAAFTGQNIAYEHYNNGYIKAIQDKALGMYTYYEYDQDGNKSFEGYISLNNPLSASAGAKDYYQYASITYDAMNRIKTVLDPKANISYEYDAASNRRMVKSIYHDGVNGAIRTQEYWYTYDSMSRFLVTMGSLAVTSTGLPSAARGISAADTTVTTNKGALGGAGVAISYNLAGERVQAVNAVDNSMEAYTYTADGYLAKVNINGIDRSNRTNDALGRVTNLVQNNASGVLDYNKASVYDQDSRVTSENGSDGTTTYAYNINGGELSQTTNVNGTNTTNTYYNYQYWDDAKQSIITNQVYNPALEGNNAAWLPGYSQLTFDVNGHVSKGIDYYGNRNFRYVSDAQGQILLRDEVTGAINPASYATNSAQNPGSVAEKITRYYYVDGKRVGDVSNDGPSRTDYIRALAKQKAPKGNYANWKPVESADFDQNYEPISPAYPAAVPSNYTVRNGDTLQTIARSVWGDSAMWYLIADANGLASGATLTAGMKLTIPNKVTNIHNNAGTFRPYNPGEAIGDVNPTLPEMPAPPVKYVTQTTSRGGGGGCGGFFSIIVAVITIAVAIVAPQIIPVIASLGPVGAAVATAAVANIAGQVAANILGVQSGFNFASLGTSILTAGITQGLIGGAKLPDGTTSIGAFGKQLGSLVQGGYAEIAARAVVGNVISQGVGNLTGQQKGFSWSSVAAAGVGAAAGAYVGGKVGAALANSNTGEIGKTASFFTAASQGLSSSVASQLTQIALDGKGRLNWSSVAISAIGAGVGALAGYNNPKDGGKVAQAPLSYRDRIVADNSNYAGTRTDGPTAVEQIYLDPVVVYGRRWTPAEIALDEAKTLATETADRLMQMNSLNQNQPRAEVRAMTPMESFATFNPVGVRLKGLGNIGNNIVGGLAGSLKENLAIVSDIKAFAIGSQTSVVTGRFDPESGILRSFQNGTLAQDSARLFGQAVTGTVKGPFDLMDGMRYGNADKIGTGGAAVLGMAGPAFGRLGRVEVATTTEFVGPGIGKSGYQSSAEFADAVGAKYQSFVDDAYRSGQNLEVKGLLRGLSSTRLGDYIDRSSARDLKSFLRSEGISEGPGSLIRMNRFMRNPESPNLYVRPDVYIPSANRIFDATVGFKSYNDVQIQRFNQFSGGSYITNVRPSMSPLGGSYSFNPNLLIKGN